MRHIKRLYDKILVDTFVLANVIYFCGLGFTMGYLPKGRDEDESFVNFFLIVCWPIYWICKPFHLLGKFLREGGFDEIIRGTMRRNSRED